MNSLPQANIVNPVEQISCKIFIGIPLLSSIHVSYDSSLFTYRNIFINKNDSIFPNFNFFLHHSAFGKIEDIRAEAQLSLIHFGF